METNIVWLGALGAALMLSCGTRDTDPRLPRAPRDGAMAREAEGARNQGSPHRFCGYIHGFEGPVPVDLGVDAFAAHAEDFDAIHPKWWRVQAAAEIVNHAFHDPAPFPGFHDARVLDHTSYRGRRTQLISGRPAERPTTASRSRAASISWAGAGATRRRPTSSRAAPIGAER